MQNLSILQLLKLFSEAASNQTAPPQPTSDREPSPAPPEQNPAHTSHTDPKKEEPTSAQALERFYQQHDSVVKRANKKR